MKDQELMTDEDDILKGLSDFFIPRSGGAGNIQASIFLEGKRNVKKDFSTAPEQIIRQLNLLVLLKSRQSTILG